MKKPALERFEQALMEMSDSEVIQHRDCLAHELEVRRLSLFRARDAALQKLTECTTRLERFNAELKALYDE